MKLNDSIENKETEKTRGAVKAKMKAETAKEEPTKKEDTVPEKIEVKEDLETKIKKWKSEYGKLYRNDIDDDNFVIWRPVRRKEYKEILDSDDEVMDVLERQDAICKLVILYPVDHTKLIESRAGLATVLSEEILRLSGFEISETKSL